MSALRRDMMVFAAIGILLGASWLLAEAQTLTVSETDAEVLQRNWDAIRARGLRLLPVPKQIRFEGQPVVLAGQGSRQVAIVLAGDSEPGRIAANEIVSRMEDFSVEADIPMIAAPREGAWNIVIEDAWPGTFTRDDTRPPEAKQSEQAYGLYPRADGIVLAGQGEIGMMYAAVTLRWLIEEQGGKVLLHPAAVVDWPDYKNRHVGSLLAPYHTWSVGSDPEAHLANMRGYIDWLFRLKATGTFRHSIGSQRYSSLPDQVPSSPEARACARIVSDYARARGIVTMHNGSVRLGTSPEDDDRPGFDQMMLDRGRNHYHSWARHDLHLNKARNMAAFCRESGFDLAFIHAVDSGGILDPEMWSHRDALTREKYGDDRVSADADMFNIYAEQFERAGAEIVFVAYPYSAEYLSEEFVMSRLGLPDTQQGRERARELVAGMTAWMRGVNEKVAPGVRICIREAPRADMFRFFAGYPQRPMWVYWELTHYRNSIYPLVTTNVRCIGAGYSPDRPAEDILWANDIDYLWFSEPLRVAACEWAWNTRFPGSAPYDPAYMRGGEAEVNDQAALDIVAERAAVGMWGGETGALMQRALATHMSWRVAVDPKKTTERLPASVLPPLVRKNRQAVRESCDAMDELWQLVQEARAEGRSLMDGFSYPFFVQFYAMTKAARAYADVHLRELQAMEAIRSADMPQAMQEIAEGRDELAANVDAYRRTMAELADEPRVMRHEDLKAHWRTRLEGQLMAPDFAALAARLDDLEAGSDRLYQEYNVPGWFRDWFAKRALTAAGASGELELDGVLAEPDWRAAPRIDQFVGHKQYKVMSMPCEARLLYDGEHLYLGARLMQPLIGGIDEPQRPGDDYSFTEQVELLLVPGEPGAENLYQFVVDTAGNLFTMRRLALAQGTERVTEGWDSGAMAAVHRGEDGWSLELAIPLEALGKPARGTWHAVIARDLVMSLEPRRVETYASAFFDGRSYHTAELHSPLRFVSAPEGADEPPGLHVTDPAMQTRTTGQGQGSEVSFGVAVETRHPLRDVVIGAEVVDREDRVLGHAEVARRDVVSLKYATPRPVLIQLENVHEGVRLRVALTWVTLAGERGSAQSEVIVGDVQAAVPEEALFTEGVTAGARATTVPVHLPVQVDGERLLSFERGTIEFWLRPRVDMAVGPERWGERFLYLFHYGPQLDPGRSSPARNSLTICHEKKGWISFALYGPDGDRRLVHSRLPGWMAGEWHHLACTWDLDDAGRSRLGLYLDGRQSSERQWGRKGGVEDHTPMVMADGAYLAQLGCLNSGRRVAEADFDELRIWDAPRYDEDFVPERETATPLPEGLAHLGFEGGFAACFRTGAREATVKATAGSTVR